MHAFRPAHGVAWRAHSCTRMTLPGGAGTFTSTSAKPAAGSLRSVSCTEPTCLMAPDSGPANRPRMLSVCSE